MLHFFIFKFLFIFHLPTVSTPCILSNGGMINDKLRGKDTEGGGHGPAGGTVSAMTSVSHR